MTDLPFIYSHGNQFARTDYFGPLPDGTSVAITTRRDNEQAPKVAIASVEATTQMVALKGMVMA